MQAAHVVDEARIKRLEEASSWVLRMEDPDRTDEQMNEWLRWCDEHPENFAEFDRLQRDWKDLDDGDAHAVREPLARPARAAWRTWGVAATVVAVAGASTIAYQLRSPLPIRTEQVASTLTNRAATLPDGSKMILGMESRVNMDFNGQTRSLELARGEAYFKVQKDRSRPFIVKAGDVSVAAVGTAFDVRRERDAVTVTVEEGTVEVTGHKIGNREVSWRAEAGYQLTYSISARTASLASVKPAVELAWRQGELSYVREPLGTVIDDLNTHSARKVHVEDEAVAALPFTGTAFAASLDDWLAGVQAAYPVTVTRLPNGDVCIASIK